MRTLNIQSYSPPFIKEFAVEVAAAIGFNALSLDFPILSDQTGITSPATEVVTLRADGSLPCGYLMKEDGACLEIVLRDQAGASEALSVLCARLAGQFASGDASIASDDAPLKEAPGIMDGGYQPEPVRRGLECMFERGFIVKDTDFDFLPDTIDATIEIPENCDVYQLSAACDMAARLGMESLGLTLPILAGKGREAGTCIRIQAADSCSVTIKTEDGRNIIAVSGNGEGLAHMAAQLCRWFPEAGPEATWPEICADVSRAAALHTLDGQLAWLDVLGITREAKDSATEKTTLYGDPAIETQRTALEKAFPLVRFRNRRDLTVLHDEEYELPWELDTCREILEHSVYSRIIPGKPASIDVVISEDGDVRNELAEAILKEACARGAINPKVRVICAFKQGFSWIRDYVLPELAMLSDLGSLELSFSPFLPNGRTAWTDEDGATPKISAERADDPDAWLDPPVRLLQELYPIDDIVAEVLDLPREQIRFSLLEGVSAPEYRVIARNSAGDMVFEAGYTVSFSERTYLDAFPGIGRVHPGTGRVSIKIPGQADWSESFSTDLENIWSVYQTKVLPVCKALIEEVCGGTIDTGRQPYFAQLRLDIDASEPDETLPVRQDRISSLESLHEDIYFAGLDYFQTLGLKSCGKGIDAPGLILPVIRKRPGRPRMRFQLLGELSAEPAIEIANKRFESPFDKMDVGVWIESLVFHTETSSFSPTLAVENCGIGESRLTDLALFIHSYALLLTTGLLRASSKLAGTPYLSFRIAGTVIRAQPPKAAPPLKPLDISSIDILEDSLIGYDEYLSLIDQFSRVPRLRVRQVAESRQGRAIHSIELLSSLPGHVSRTKLIAARPVYYVNARHHANEVSGTNAAFMLLRTLLTDPVYAGIADKVNIVIVPFENADGAAIHYELAKDNPEWILHIARYNSLGKELAHEYWNDSTIHTEALAFTKVWRDWLPDVVTDNHGVPTHEWCQQFSGYTSPWFKGFWMPRALLYGYFWYVTDQRYAGNKALSEGIQSAVAEHVGADPECRSINAEWKDRFEKYAHAWMPRLFPAEYHKDMIFYWVPYPYRSDYYYASVKYPWITASSFVTEVSDETATGSFLRLCARTHELNDLAVIRLLAEAHMRTEWRAGSRDATHQAFRSRIRPPIPM